MCCVSGWCVGGCLAVCFVNEGCVVRVGCVFGCVI